ncbi:GNAT family N-acetyltransferase [Flavobacterium plurextorum]|uniref:GNAT family N-acetyltransferase n=1 Tax=Flavobacterium plurextorum TaxID=1114867 RepID=UPI0037562EB3
MVSYKAFQKQIFSEGNYSIVPIRFEDRMDIMKWRNEQIYHLRQAKPLTIDDQNFYFENVVAKLFDQNEPNQILFSFLENEICVGYGGLVHINWNDKNAEISFVMDTESQKSNFKKYWSIYLGLIETFAFDEINLHKVYTYAFDLRPHLYEMLEDNGYEKEAVLKEHCLFNGRFIDVIIHSKSDNVLKDELYLREANIDDAELLFTWANDPDVRKNSIVQEQIVWEKHLAWFKNKVNSSETKIFILNNKSKCFGQIRIDKVDSQWQIDYSIDPTYRGQGLGKEIVKRLLDKFDFKFKATVKRENNPSAKVFTHLGFRTLQTDNKDFLFFEY